MTDNNENNIEIIEPINNQAIDISQLRLRVTFRLWPGSDKESYNSKCHLFESDIFKSGLFHYF